MEGGTVCVTGATGYLASWLTMKLLQHGYRVHATIRSHSDNKHRDISYLTSLPGASENLQIFNADLEHPETFCAAIDGCTGVFHVAHPIDFEGKVPQEEKNKRSIEGTLQILRACLDSKTVKRVVYTSSASAVAFNQKGLGAVDETVWSEIGFIETLKPLGGSYFICKTLTERAALEFAQEHGLDLVTVIPGYVNGPFIGPQVPSSVSVSLAMIFGEQDNYKLIKKIPMVHIDDVANAYIFLFEYPHAKGRYICSSLDATIEEMSQFLSSKYPEYQIPPPDSLKDVGGFKFPDFSSQKLLDAGFKYKYGLEEMYEEAIQCCKDKGFL